MRNLPLFLFSHRLLAIARWDLHFLWVRIRNALTLQPRRVRRFLATRQTPVLLNFGSGPRGIDDAHWVNIDGYSDRNVHFLLDFGRRLPFPDESFDGVFSEHVLEHFSLEDGEKLVRELRRVLKPGGCLRIVVPDAETILRTYFDAPAELIARRGGTDETPMGTVNAYFRQRYEHQFLYDWATLEKMLARAGYAKIARVARGEAQLCRPLVLDDSKYEWESLYVEARKT